MSSAAPPPASRTGHHAFLVGLAIFLSKMAGFVREMLTSYYLGNSLASAAWRNALKIPNVLQNLLGEGVISASFIPVHAKLVAEGDEEAAGRVAGIVGALLALVAALASLAGVLFTPAIVALIAPGLRKTPELQELTVRLVRIAFPGMSLLVMSAWCLGILNSRRRFFLSYTAPVAWNAAMVAALVLGGRAGDVTRLVVLMTWAAVGGAFLQLAVQVPHVLRLERGLRPGLDWRYPPVAEILRNVVPVVIGRGVVQLSAYVDVILVSWLGGVAISALGFVQTVYMLPIGLFGMSVAVAELPEMSSATGSHEEIHEALRKRLRDGLRRVAFLVVPTVAAFVFLGRILLAAYLERGKFGPEDTRLTWYILLGSAVGLLAATMGRLVSSAFYALRDTRTPLRFAVLRIALTAGLGALFAFPLRPLFADLLGLFGLGVPDVEGGEKALGACGLTLSAGLAGWVEFLLLSRALQARIGKVELGARQLGRFWLAALAASAAALAADHVVLAHALEALSPGWGNIARALGCCLVFGVVYLPLSGVRLESLRRFTRR